MQLSPHTKSSEILPHTKKLLRLQNLFQAARRTRAGTQSRLRSSRPYTKSSQILQRTKKLLRLQNPFYAAPTHPSRHTKSSRSSRTQSRLRSSSAQRNSSVSKTCLGPPRRTRAGTHNKVVSNFPHTKSSQNPPVHKVVETPTPTRPEAARPQQTRNDLTYTTDKASISNIRKALPHSERNSRTHSTAQRRSSESNWAKDCNKRPEPMCQRMQQKS